ncbi:hypothetical protein [Flavivirga algicola]|uniref:MotA/TolQ/ExbB proton channel domain-containing protein n=1 Tax=Flavivirga algicola TaxID=2729136 RepID=A0ABX1RYP2_9FLAO|nr:hypothetical protein [Flavivirga algicola]NMH88236.1 hypothetical protein [Flavivirga algicola]
MKVFIKYWWLLLLLLIVTLIFFMKFNEITPGTEWRNEPEKILAGMAAGLIVVGTLLDQFIAVFFRENEETQIKRRIVESRLYAYQEKRRMRRKDILREELNNRDGNRSETINRLEIESNALEASIIKEKEQISNLNTERTTYIQMVAFGIGLVLATAGIRTLTPFIVIPDEATGLNFKLLFFCDILFTAALLSGGTAGIHQFLDIIRDSWKRHGVTT